MTQIQVLLAPVPCEHLASALSVPTLKSRVAFGSSQQGLNSIQIGLDVYIYASQPPHALFKGPVVSWTGRLGAVIPAVTSGRRNGKHPDASVRPPTAELGDGPFLAFWEVLNLQQLSKPIPLRDFFDINSKPLFEYSNLQWPTIAYLDGKI